MLPVHPETLAWVAEQTPPPTREVRTVVLDTTWRDAARYEYDQYINRVARAISKARRMRFALVALEVDVPPLPWPERDA
jgi:hypothetical protein